MHQGEILCATLYVFSVEGKTVTFKMKYRLLLTILLPLVFSLNLNLIEDYLKKSVEIKNVLIFSCSNVHNFHKLAVFLSNSNIYFSFVLDFKLDDLTRYGAGTMLVDYSCSESNIILLKSSKFNYFNSSYHWIILNDQNISSDDIFANIPNIGLNSNIILMSKMYPNVYDMFEVYSKGLQLGEPVTVKNVGTWRIETGFNNDQPIYLYNRQNRGDLGGLEVRGGMMRLYNLSPDSIYHTQVNRLLMHIFNFK